MKSKKNKLFVKFKVKCFSKDKPYFNVYIFRDQESMYRFFLKENKKYCKDPETDFLAICQTYRTYKINPDGSEKMKDCIGNVLFYKDFIGGGVVSHEFVHAALHWYGACKAPHKKGWIIIKNMEPDEEDICHAQSNMVVGFWLKYYELEEEIKSL